MSGWLLLVGGEAWWPGGQKVHRTAAQSCAPADLASAIEENLNLIYGLKNDFDPPLPHMDTWALGMRVKDKKIIDEQVLPAWRHRCKRLHFSDYGGGDFDEDFPVVEGADDNRPRGKLSRAATMLWMQQFAEFLGDVSGAAMGTSLYEFSDRPEGFPGPQEHSLPEITKQWKRATVDSIPGAVDAAARVAAAKRKSPTERNAADAAKARHAKQTLSIKKEKELNGIEPAKAVLDALKDRLTRALQEAGYRSFEVREMMNSLKAVRNGKYSCRWSIKLLNGKRITRSKSIPKRKPDKSPRVGNGAARKTPGPSGRRSTDGDGASIDDEGSSSEAEGDEEGEEGRPAKRPRVAAAVAKEAIHKQQGGEPTALAKAARSGYQLTFKRAERAKEAQQCKIKEALLASGYEPHTTEQLLRRTELLEPKMGSKGRIEVPFRLFLPGPGIRVSSVDGILLNSMSVYGSGYAARAKRTEKEQDGGEDRGLGDEDGGSEDGESSSTEGSGGGDDVSGDGGGPVGSGGQRQHDEGLHSGDSKEWGDLELDVEAGPESSSEKEERSGLQEEEEEEEEAGDDGAGGEGVEGSGDEEDGFADEDDEQGRDGVSSGPSAAAEPSARGPIAISAEPGSGDECDREISSAGNSGSDRDGSGSSGISGSPERSGDGVGGDGGGGGGNGDKYGDEDVGGNDGSGGSESSSDSDSSSESESSGGSEREKSGPLLNHMD